MDGRDPQSIAAARQTGLIRASSETRDAGIKNITLDTGHQDYYVLCMTEDLDPTAMHNDFGEFWVQINEPENFFVQLTRSMALRFNVLQAVFAPVAYSGREFHDTEVAPAPIPLLKPKDRYAHQKEIRMVWNVAPEHHPLQPFELHSPAARRFCGIVPSIQK